MVLLLVESHSIPIVTAQMTIKAGSRFDSPDKAGLAHLTASLLQSGTQTRQATEISDAIDFIGGKLTVEAHSDSSSAFLKVLRKDVETGFDILSDIIRNPAFSQKELDRKKREVLGEILGEKENPGLVARKAFNEIIFSNHPFQYPVIGLEKTLSRIKRKDVIQFHQSYYRPNNSMIAIVGDLTESEARGLVRKYFENWEKGPIKPPAILPPTPLHEKKMRIIDQAVTQSNIVLGHLGVPKNHPDYHALLVMNYILGGGGFSSRLMTEVRDNQGLAYHISSRFQSYLDVGTFLVVLQTKNSSANQAIQQVLSEIQRIQTEPVTDRELKESRAFLMGSFPLRLDTSSKLSNFLTSIELYGLGLDYLDRFPKIIASISKEDVLQVAQKYLQADRYLLVAVANKAEASILSPGLGKN
jgi:zinc protease